MMIGMTEDDAAPGWDAIDAALAPLYHGVRPFHVGYGLPAALSTNLQGCSAYAAGDHWHYVTYGLSDLWVKNPDDVPEISGWGFELTMRVRGEVSAEPPQWPFVILNKIANYINENGVVLGPGHRVDFRQPVTGYPHTTDGPDTGLTVLAFVVDPQLGTVGTPNGRLAFYQAVGVTAAEKARMVETSTQQVLDEFAIGNPLLVTDVTRA
jgi:hypothetical protein